MERHIRVFQEVLDKLIVERACEQNGRLEDSLRQLEQLVGEAIQFKNSFGRYGGSSPSQWMTGRRHPLFDGEDVPPIGGDDTDALTDHLERRNQVAKLFYAADAKATLKLAENARNRIVREPAPGMLVYYYRRGKKDKTSYISE